MTEWEERGVQLVDAPLLRHLMSSGFPTRRNATRDEALGRWDAWSASGGVVEILIYFSASSFVYSVVSAVTAHPLVVDADRRSLLRLWLVLGQWCLSKLSSDEASAAHGGFSRLGKLIGLLHQKRDRGVITTALERAVEFI